MDEKVQLNKNAIGVGESIIMGVAGTAPAFSIAATTSTLIAVVGVLSPASLLYCGLIMFGVTFSYIHLNRILPNAGASYAWVGKVFHPLLGFFAGWALLVASAVFMVSGTVPAATATLSLFKPALANDPAWVTFIASAWLLVVSSVIVKGIKPTSYSQILMTGVEVVILLAIIVAALVQYAKLPAHHFAWSWFSATAFTPQSFATGALTSLFFFWGWDVTVNLNEETRNAAHAPGQGAFWAMIIVLLMFIAFSVVTLLVLNDQEIEQAGTNVVLAVASKIFPTPWNYMAVIAVMLSTIGTLETSILQFTRTMYAKGRDGVLHRRYAILHKKWQTPWVATFLVTALGLIFLFLSSYFPSVNQMIKASVNAIGFQVAFYYSLAGFACAWYFRNRIQGSIWNLWIMVIWPCASAAFLVFIGIYSVPTFDLTTRIVAIGGILIGLVPYWLNRKRLKSLE
jgi:amino acid transporter